MKFKQVQVFAVALSCASMLISPMATAAPVSANAATPVIQAPRDIALHQGTDSQGGVLVGQMLDAQGAAIAGATVSVRTSGKEVARALTDQTGKFQVTGLKGGVHQVATAGQQDVYRLWAPQTAPPAAQQGLMLVSNTDVVRGQTCGTPVCGSACSDGGGGGVFGGGGGRRGIGNWIANHPLITAGAIATAIAVPLALDDDDTPPATP
ncbi:MAG: carboxypeptidase regulatory-like domain-containing protein [Planctomycetes bacterium]|nr:carboxypeptidase regulatory-like domain-containing protein [Planctomycetota bacterium]